MTADEVRELYYIAPIGNLASVLTHGILSHKLAARLPHGSIAKQEIQDIRARKVVPGGLPLHDYANLYICARNPMMYLRRGTHRTLCVLRVSTDVLYFDNVVVASGNASSQYTRFAASPQGLVLVDRDLVFAEYWTDPDQITYWRKQEGGQMRRDPRAAFGGP